MNVYTYYDDSPAAPEQQARMIKLWAQSWAKHGWSPKLLTRRMAEAHPGYTPDKHWCRPLFAVAHFGKTGMITKPNVMNFGLKPTRRFGNTARCLNTDVYWTTRDCIKFSRKAKCVQVNIDMDYLLMGYAGSFFPGRVVFPLVKFGSNDPMEVLEHPRWR